MTILNPYFSSPRRNLNPYFSFNGENSSNKNEQDIVSSLISEKIQQFGIKTKYILRTPYNLDTVFGESAGSNFTDCFDIEMDMKDYTGMQGTDNAMPFGYNMADSIMLECSFDRMNSELETLGNEDRIYPQVGDLIFIPLFKDVVEIKYVNTKNPSFITGKRMLYEFSCQMFNYNSETFSTDDPSIDIINQFDEKYMKPESNNEIIQTEADEYIIEEPNAWKTILKQE